MMTYLAIISSYNHSIFFFKSKSISMSIDQFWYFIMDHYYLLLLSRSLRNKYKYF